MNSNDTEAAVLYALKDSLEGVTMSTPVDQIVSGGRARRRNRRVAGAATASVAIAGLAVGMVAVSHPSTAPPTGRVQTVAYTVERHGNGTITVSWNKQRYFQDHAGLEQALRRAGLPVLIREGEFCKGPGDDGYLNPSGQGRGIDHVMTGVRSGNGTVTLVFKPSGVPAGQQLFIGYLNPAQLAVTHGRPGSVERLVPLNGPLTCTTQPPAPHN